MRAAVLGVAVAVLAGCGAEEAARDGGLPPAIGPATAPEAIAAAIDREGAHGERLVGPAGGRGVRVRGWLLSAAPSPDGRRVALGVGQGGRLQLVDLPPRRTGTLVETDAGTPIAEVAWPAADRVLAVSGHDPMSQGVLLDVDPRAGVVRRTTPLDGAVVATATSRLGLTAVLGPAAEVGEATLLHVGPDGRARTWRLPGVAAGAAVDTSRDHRLVERTPGLALSEADARAFVVAPGRGLRIVEVDLRTGRTAAHRVAARRGPIAALLGAVVGTAEAKAGERAARQAHWLGGGRLAVTGVDEAFDHATGEHRSAPVGLRIVDVRDWTAQTLDRHATYVVRAGDGVAAGDGVGDAWGGIRFDGPKAARRGVRVFGAAGERRWAHGAGTSLTPRFQRGRALHVLDHRARRMLALDVATGRPLGAPVPPGRVPLPLP